MASKGYSGTSFWARQVGLALVLIIVAAVLIYLQEGSDSSTGAPKKSVSSGLSDFYRDFRQSTSEVGNSASSEFVVDVEKSEEDLDTQLKSRASKHRPVPEAWVGEHKFRSFKAGNTLREVISDYAEKEGMQVVWDLEQDFVIKHHFQVDDTLVGALTQIASAVNSNFTGDVHAYMCADQRSLVVTATATDFLLEQCARVN